MALDFQRKIEKQIDAEFSIIEQQNQKKQEEFIVRIRFKQKS